MNWYFQGLTLTLTFAVSLTANINLSPILTVVVTHTIIYSRYPHHHVILNFILTHTFAIVLARILTPPPFTPTRAFTSPV